ncbi:Cilia- and flagella-associated protein 298 like protein [Argiope bruennichi]|uniref:Cilia- and flagella-associated protein 298 like protein n=1 Tax=Argiope bruennichi TaxID=94029 RepID=A0A8T0F5H8_ARGBR|nr:Cilia- and flagella-associated protein 298 like protein [Argiope bruennichi]
MNFSAPKEKHAEILTKTTAEAKTRISQIMIDAGICLTIADIEDTLHILCGAVKICYPMGLPSYEIISQELEGKEDLSGTQASKEILEPDGTELWLASRKLDLSKILSDYIGKNEKSKIVVKLQKKGSDTPAKESALT